MTILRGYPSTMPAVTLDFAGSKKLDPRIDFERASNATTTPPTLGEGTGAVNGQIFEFQENVPRLTDQGLLIEESRTNSCKHSENFSTSPWATDNGNVPPGTNTTAPDGTNTASAFMEDVIPNSGTGVHWLKYDVQLMQINTNSIFVKPNGRETVVLQQFAGPYQYVSVVFNLTGDGVKGEVKVGDGNNPPAGGIFAHIDSDIEPYSNGWYRISLTVERTPGQNYFYPILLSTCTNSDPDLDDYYGVELFTGDSTKGVWVWGAQFEYEKKFPTSYIPTSGSTATRAPDLMSIQYDNFTSWYNPEEGTFVMDLDFNGTTGSNLFNMYPVSGPWWAASVSSSGSLR